MEIFPPKPFPPSHLKKEVVLLKPPDFKMAWGRSWGERSGCRLSPQLSPQAIKPAAAEADEVAVAIAEAKAILAQANCVRLTRRSVDFIHENLRSW